MNKLNYSLNVLLSNSMYTNFHRLNSSLIHRMYLSIHVYYVQYICTEGNSVRLSFVTATVETQAPFSKSGLDLASNY